MFKKLMFLSFGLVLMFVLAMSVSSRTDLKRTAIPEDQQNLWQEPEGDSKAPCYWQWWYSNLTYSYSVPDLSFGHYAYAQRFSTACSETLMGANVYINDNNDGTFGDDDVYVTVYDDDGTGLPGLAQATVTLAAGTYNAYPIPTYANFAGFNLVFTGDFHIGISTSATVNHENILSDDDFSPTGRGSYADVNGVWYSLASIGWFSDFLIDVYLCTDWQWIPGDDHKMHYPQLPDEAGWDVKATYPIILADDWQCSETGWIKDIHFWGSWKDNIEGIVDSFLLSFHHDIPAGVPGPYGSYYNYGDCNQDGINLAVSDLVALIRYLMGIPSPRPYYPWYDFNGDCIIDEADAVLFNSYFIYGLSVFPEYPIPTCGPAELYSRPGETITEMTIKWFGVTPMPDYEQGWYDPVTEEYFYNNHWLWYQYDICLPESLWVWQDQDTIYWLNICAFVSPIAGSEDSVEWGWKSSYMHWNDDAVWAWWGNLVWDDIYEPPFYDYIPGDVNHDGHVDLADAVYLQNWISGGPPPPYVVGGFYPAADVDGNCMVPTVADMAYLVNYLMSGGPPPIYCPNYPPLCNYGTFGIEFDAVGNLVNGWGSAFYGEGWFYYDWYGWWNMWWYDHPFDTLRKKIIRYGVDFTPTHPTDSAYVELAVTWSSDHWTDEASPPLPGVDEDLYIERRVLYAGYITSFVHFDFDYVIPWYNPVWASIDVMGTNVIIEGSIEHCCFQSLDLAFVITGEPPDTNPPPPIHEGDIIFHNIDGYKPLEGNPLGTRWHELWPNFCELWDLTSWFDNGDGILSVCDYVDFTNVNTTEWRKFHIEWIGPTLTLEWEETDTIYVEYICNEYPLVDNIYNPIGTWWHEVYPNYCETWGIVCWEDNGNGYLDSCDWICIQNYNTSETRYVHVAGVETDIIMNEIIPDPPEPLPEGTIYHNDDVDGVNLDYPMGSMWHELYPVYCHYWELTSWFDNGDNTLSVCDYVDFTNVEDSSWKKFHVEWIGWTIEVERVIEPSGPIYLDLNDVFLDPLDVIIGSYWHEVYPNYCTDHFCVDWIDNGSGVLDSCDYLILQNMDTGEFEEYHVTGIKIDIILEEITPTPPEPLPGGIHLHNPYGWRPSHGSPIEIYWHELWPDYCNDWVISSYRDNGDGVLSVCDTLDFNGDTTKWYHVEWVGPTIKVEDPNTPSEPPLYMDYADFDNPDNAPMTSVVGTYWHEVFPTYCQYWYVVEWNDNGSGYLDSCDYILIQNMETGNFRWYHVLAVQTDMIIKEVQVEYPVRWRFHPKYVNGWLTVWGTRNCQRIHPPLFTGYVVACNTYSGYLPRWYNDYLIRFQWDYICGNVDRYKVAVPRHTGTKWELVSLANWLEAHFDGKQGDSLMMPTVGDSTGDIQNVYIIANPEEYAAGKVAFQDEYIITDGTSPDLPGYLIGTTPIVFNPDAPPKGSPFETDLLTGTLYLDGDVIFGLEGDCDCEPGETNGDLVINIFDVTGLISYLYLNGPAPMPYPLCSGDMNCDCVVNIFDVTGLISYLYLNGTPPCTCEEWLAACGPPLRK